jgi:hypothetical protein
VRDIKGDQRRIHLSTSVGAARASLIDLLSLVLHVLGVDCTMQHARLPMPFVRRSTWINLAIDVAGIVKECFKVYHAVGASSTSVCLCFACRAISCLLLQVDMFALDFIQIHSSVRIKRVFALNHSKAAPPLHSPSPLPALSNRLTPAARAFPLTWKTRSPPFNPAQ